MVRQLGGWQAGLALQVSAEVCWFVEIQSPSGEAQRTLRNGQVSNSPTREPQSPWQEKGRGSFRRVGGGCWGTVSFGPSGCLRRGLGGYGPQ